MKSIVKTFSAKPANVKHGWFVVNAEGKTLGRLASAIATRLKGKHKPEYTPHVDTGDYIVVVNVEGLTVTGNKAEDKVYYRHSGYPGGLKTETYAKRKVRNPALILEEAVKGMLPKNSLGRDMFRKLFVYSGNNHPHAAQQPQLLNEITG